MRLKFTYLLFSAFLLIGGGQAMADSHNNGKARQEQGNNHRPGNKGNSSGNKNHNGAGNKHNGFGNKNHNGGNKNHFGNDKKHDKHHNDKHHNDKHFGKPGNNVKPAHPAPAHRPGKPVPPPPPAPVMRPGTGAAFHPGPAMPPPPPPRLPHMVRYATRGCHDVAVWQVSPDTYLVKYRRGGRWYTQYVYPYAERYGAPTLISVNWQPLSPWTLIPSVQLNINL